MLQWSIKKMKVEYQNWRQASASGTILRRNVNDKINKTAALQNLSCAYFGAV